MTTHFEFRRRALIVVLIVWLVFSLALVVAPQLTRQFFGLLIYASSDAIDAFGAAAVAYISLLHAVLGAVMFGWGAALFCVAIGPLKRKSFQAWLTLALSLSAWFVPDTAYSLWSGFWQNAVFNMLFLVMFAIPLLACYPACRAPKHTSKAA